MRSDDEYGTDADAAVVARADPPSSRTPLSTQRIVGTAIEFIDEHGLPGLSHAPTRENGWASRPCRSTATCPGAKTCWTPWSRRSWPSCTTTRRSWRRRAAAGRISSSVWRTASAGSRCATRAPSR